MIRLHPKVPTLVAHPATSSAAGPSRQNIMSFIITAPDGQFINRADSEKNAFKMLGAKNKRDRDILIKAGFKVTENLSNLPILEEKPLTSAPESGNLNLVS